MCVCVCVCDPNQQARNLYFADCVGLQVISCSFVARTKSHTHSTPPRQTLTAYMKQNKKGKIVHHFSNQKYPIAGYYMQFPMTDATTESDTENDTFVYIHSLGFFFPCYTIKEKFNIKGSYLEFSGMAGNVFYFTFVSLQLKQLFKDRILKETNKENVTYQIIVEFI